VAISGRRATVGFGWPRIAVDGNEPIASFDPNAPASRRVAAWQRIRADFVDVVAARLSFAHNRPGAVDRSGMDERAILIAHSQLGAFAACGWGALGLSKA